MKAKRTIRDRDDTPLLSLMDKPKASNVKTPVLGVGPILYAYSIDAKLLPSHAGVGSWALLYAQCESHARGIYDELFPGRVIVTVRRSARSFTLEQLTRLNKLGTVERAWLQFAKVEDEEKPVAKKRVIRDR